MKKNKFYTVVIVGAIISFVGLIYLVRNFKSSGYRKKISKQKTYENKKVNSKLQVDKTAKNIGKVPLNGGLVYLSYDIKNVGEESVILGKGETSCMCTKGYIVGNDGERKGPITMTHRGMSAKFLGKKLKPGEKVSLEVEFDPDAHGPKGTGPVYRTLQINTNSTKTPTLKFSFEGNVIK